MFDEGENEVTINLPKAVKQIAEDQSEEPNLEQIFDMEDEKEIMPIRDFSISTWNGIAGLKYWGYSSKEEEKSK